MTHPLHFGVDHEVGLLGDVALPSILMLAGIASAAIVALAIVALARRRSRSYLLITMALATLLGRTIVGWLAMGELLPVGVHHLIEHTLDGVMAVLLLAAVYYARTTGRMTRGERA